MKTDTQFLKKASIVDKDGSESGWSSVIQGITSDNPRKLRGARVNNLYFEEAGSNPVLVDTYVQSRALVDILGRRVGSRFVFGTGGDKTAALAGLKKMFYNPADYSILPYKNYYNRLKELAFTGYFIPSYTLWFGTDTEIGFDSRGVVDEEKAKKYYQDKWDKIEDAQLLIKDKAEYCFTPEDAFILEGSNAFNAEKLAEQLLNIEQGLIEKPKKVNLKWGLLDGQVNRNSKPTPEYIETGKILVAEAPMTDPDGIPFENLYVAAIDSIDTSVDTTTGQTDLSQFCVLVYRRQFGLKDPKIVALYKFRPKQITDAYDTALKLCQWYNCKVLVEATRVGVIEYFKNKGFANYLMRKPKSVNSGRNSTQFGVPASTNIIEHQLDLIGSYIENYYTNIDYLEVIDECQRYSFENKRKFDIVAAFGIVLLADEDMLHKIPRVVEDKENKELNKIGYYKNAWGQIEFGVIPDKPQVNYGGLEKYGRYRT